MNQYYKNHAKVNKEPLSRGEYGEVVNELLDGLLTAVISKNYMIRLPHSMGTVMLLKRSTKTEFIDGKLKTNRPIDYAATNKLWSINEEAKTAKKVVYHENRHSDGYVFRLSYLKGSAIYKNKSVYWMQMNRGKKRQLGQNIKNGVIDALLK